MTLPDTTAPAAHNPACVINCVHYDDDGKRHDISLDAISDVIASGNGLSGSACTIRPIRCC